MRKPLGKMFIFMVALATVWCVVLPFVWAYNMQHVAPSLMTYLELLGLYIPELAAGTVFLVCLPTIYRWPRFAARGLAIAAALMFLLKFTYGSAADAWVVSVPLLLFLSWRLHALTSGLPA